MTRLRTLCLCLLAWPALAAAELLEYRYTDTLGQARAQPPTTEVANPASPLDLVASGGLDRRLRAELWGRGAVWGQAESRLLTSRDRLTVNGKDYYGAVLPVTAPPDGTYEVRVSILDSAGAAVQTDYYVLQVDTAPPEAGAFAYVGNTSEGSLALFGDVYTTAIQMNGVRDTQGIDRIVAETAYLDGDRAGQVAVRGPGRYDAGAQTASIGSPLRNWYPQHRQRYRLSFEVYDRAGNRAVRTLDHGYSSDCGTRPVPVAARRPGSTAQFLGQALFTGFEPWSHGGVLYENPPTLIWRLPKTNWIGQTPYGMDNFAVAYQDTEFVYATMKKPLTATPNSNNGQWGTATTWGCQAWDGFQGTLAEGVTAAPKWVRGDIAVDGRWISGLNTRPQNLHAPFTVTGLRAEVETRPYAQVVTVYAPGQTPSCTIPVGATTCELALQWQPADERGYSPWLARIDNEAREFNTFGDYFYLYWDYAAPLIESLTVDTATRQATLTVTDPHTVSGWQLPHWAPQTVQVLARRQDGSEVALTPVSATHPTTPTYLYTFNLAALPDGDYTLAARVVSCRIVPWSRSTSRSRA